MISQSFSRFDYWASRSVHYQRHRPVEIPRQADGNNENKKNLTLRSITGACLEGIS
jgi:hypothetical protein